MLALLRGAELLVFQFVLSFAQEGVAGDDVVAGTHRDHRALFPIAGCPRRDLGLLREPTFFRLAVRYLVFGSDEVRRHLSDEAGENGFALRRRLARLAAK